MSFKTVAGIPRPMPLAAPVIARFLKFLYRSVEGAPGGAGLLAGLLAWPEGPPHYPALVVIPNPDLSRFQVVIVLGIQAKRASSRWYFRSSEIPPSCSAKVCGGGGRYNRPILW